MAPKKKFDVFLSHNSKDRFWVLALKDTLETYGIKVWLDKDEIRPGDLFAKALEKGIQESKSVALIISPEAMESGWVQNEYYRALSLATNNQLQLIPVLYNKATIPLFLGDRNWVDFSDEGKYEENIKRLIWGVTGNLPGRSERPKHQPRASSPSKKNTPPKNAKLTTEQELPSAVSYKEIDKSPKTDSDRPSGIDRLNYGRYAQSFARIILNHETSTPLTIGIYGQWGQGKSFLMGKIKEELGNAVKKKTASSALWKKYQLKTLWESVNAWFEELSLQQITKPLNSFSSVVSEWSEQFLLVFEQPKTLIEKYSAWMNVREKARKETVDFHVVEFNAWAYVGTDHLWAGLVTHLYKEIEKYFGLRVTLARFVQALKKTLPKSIPIFILYGLLGFGISFLLDFNETQKGWEDVTFALKAIVGALLGGTALAGLPVLLTTLKEFVDNFVLTHSKNLQNLAAKPDFKAQIGIMADIKDEIRFMGELLRKGRRGHPTRFVLFIDDLDRCEHKKAVEVMQAIMLLLTDEDGAPFVIFMGIDARVIVHAIEETYGDVLVKAGINGYEYLDKIVQIPFVIPSATPEVIKQYVDSMIWTEEEKSLITKKKAELAPTDDSVSKPIIEGKLDATLDDVTTNPIEEIPVSFTEEERSAIDQCTEVLISNPRKIKRIINIYRYARLILPNSLEHDRAKAVRWFVMTEQWPLHMAWILEFIENDRQRKKKLTDKKMLDIYKLARKNIHSKEMELLLTIDADSDNFVKFMKENNFSVQDILVLLPITFNLNPAIRSEVSKQVLKAFEIKPKTQRKRTISRRTKPVVQVA